MQNANLKFKNQIGKCKMKNAKWDVINSKSKNVLQNPKCKIKKIMMQNGELSKCKVQNEKSFMLLQPPFCYGMLCYVWSVTFQNQFVKMC